MAKITLLQCPLIDIDIAIARYPGCRYWDETYPEIDGIEVNRETVLRVVSGMTGVYLLNGLIPASGIDRMTQLSLVNLARSRADLHVILTIPPIEISSDLFPFVSIAKIDLPKGDRLVQLLAEYGHSGNEIYKSALGLSEGELRRILAEPLDELCEQLREYRQGKIKAMGFTLIPKPDVELAGLDNLNQLLDNASKLLSPAAAKQNLTFPKGVLMWGIPGSGKTLAAKHAASRMGLPMIALDWNTLLSPVAGESEARLRYILEMAEASAPSLLYCDDFDKAFSGADLGNVSSTEKRITGILLTWLQDNEHPVYVMASVNRAEQMPPELLRRFEDIIFFDYPHHGQAQRVFALHLNKYTDSFDASMIEWQQILMQYNYCTPAEIGRAVKKCAERAYFEGRPGQITPQDIIEQRSNFVSGFKRDEAAILRIMKNASLAIPATSEDNSEFKIKNSKLFENYLGGNDG